MKPHLKGVLTTTLFAALLLACDNAPTAQSQPKSGTEKAAMLQTPRSIAIEHGELHELLADAAAEDGEIGAAARALEAARKARITAFTMSVVYELYCAGLSSVIQAL